MELIFATNNKNKLTEINAALNGRFHLISLEEAGIHQDIPEPFDTLEENARAKSQEIYRLTGKNCFSEDTGLEVDALQGAPGVKSARYAGDQRSASDNIDLLLEKLSDQRNRNACFRTVISLILNGKEYQFEGICNGKILKERRGDSGFGYDPVFVPDGSQHSFGEMELEEKNLYSHRRKALDKLVVFLNTLTTNT